MHDKISMFLIILKRFYHFRTFEHMRKHAFAGQNTQHVNKLNFLDGHK